MSDQSGLMQRGFPPQLHSLLREIGGIAKKGGLALYLVGGPVRDLLLERHISDIDLVVEGDAQGLASTLAEALEGRVTARSQFGTATLKLSGQRIDLVIARKETYRRPGALPTVSPGTIEDDLRRRDFSINAMAIDLSPEGWGRLRDHHGGLDDLSRKLIRVLHDKSFVDDATRILRALRYESRLDFQLEERTEGYLRLDVECLSTISGDRLRRELQHTLSEEHTIDILLRAQALGVLRAVHPALCLKEETVEKARPQEPAEEGDRVLRNLAALTHPLERAEAEDFIQRLNMPAGWRRVVLDTQAVKALAPDLEAPSMAPSQVYQMLTQRSPQAVSACAMLEHHERARERLSLYLRCLRYVKTALTGQHLLRLGVSQGPAVGEVLQELLLARLDGQISSRQEEEELVWRRVSEG